MAITAVQLMYAPLAVTRENSLAPRSRVEFTELPASVSLDDSGELFRLEATERGGVRLRAGAGASRGASPSVPLSFAGETGPVESRELHSGMEWTAGGWSFRVAFVRERPRISFWSRALARLGQLLVVLFLAVQLWVMFGLQGIVLDSGVLENSSDRLAMMKGVEALQKRLQKMEGDSPLKKSILAALREEVAARMRFLKNYENLLRRSERRRMKEDSRKMEEFLDMLEQDAHFGEVGQLDVDGAVKKILEVRR
jgi:hypothetical protein